MRKLEWERRTPRVGPCYWRGRFNKTTLAVVRVSMLGGERFDWFLSTDDAAHGGDCATVQEAMDKAQERLQRWLHDAGLRPVDES